MASLERFDVIIVGAGTAGCVLAARLTEDPARRVLLLEAGGRPPRLLATLPGLAPLLRHKGTDWKLMTAPQGGLDGRRLHVPRGRMLGGSGAMNTMLQINGHRQDYDDWAAAGCAGWGADDLQPFFDRATRAPHDPPARGGQVVDQPQWVCELWQTWIAAGVAQGLPRNEDFNGPDMLGVGLYPVTVHRGRRHHTGAAYLAPARARSGLTIRTDAWVRTLTVERGRVTGLAYTRRGRLHAAAADEVVLAAGSIGSPHILLRSGIGAATALEAAGVSVRHALPGVGQNLHDHVMVPLVWGAARPVTYNRRLHNGLVAWDMLRGLLARRGELTTPSPACGGFARLGGDDPRPNVQWHVANAWSLDIDAPPDPPKADGFTILPGIVRPHSRGHVALDPGDPFGPPLIDPAVLSDRRDAELIGEAIELTRSIMHQPPFEGLRGPPIIPEVWPTDAAGRIALARQRAITIYHPVGTCRMGVGDDAVVDPQLRVRGLDGLRVIDASIMPTIPCGNTNAPTVAIAEKGAALLDAG